VRDRPGPSRPIVAVSAAIVAVFASAVATEPTTRSVTTSRGPFPLVVYAPSAPDPALPLVIVLSGEGGWRSFDDKLARWLADAGFSTGGFDAMKYFWRAQDDRAALASDVRAYLAALAEAAGRPASSRVMLVGFSFGADLAPWIAGGGGWDERVAGLVMLGPDTTGSLEFRVSEMLGFEASDHVFDVAAALKDVPRVPSLFLHGGADRSSAAPALAAAAPGPKEIVVVPAADHHFAGRETELRRALLAGIRRMLGPPP